jgi:hypothetical protein
MAKAKEAKGGKDSKSNSKGDNNKAKKGSGGKGSKGDTDSGGGKAAAKLKGMTINVRHILVSLSLH